MNSRQLIRFEDKVKKLWETGKLPMLIHLCGGNESFLAAVFSGIKPQDYVCSTHRAHYHYLLKGGSPDDLLRKIKRGQSMFLFNRKINFLSSSIVSGNCSIAAGLALGLKRRGSKARVWCFIGDGAEDQGHFYEAVRLVHGRKLPCTFIIEDNDRSVDSPKEIRYGRDPFVWPRCVVRYWYHPVYPHAGSGCKHHIVFDQAIVKNLTP